ncbi:proline--tRNA ligase [Candidatus Daviesbacteria bacterium RIFCSPLOWO2_01_FULL_43_38]|uniref:Proline--tRNA ligase n=3 Tax=Candidatus Daviesiibacteriota TaxID=1752718 RepID=A0A1F5K7E4_9BACT|nr:MAG: Proline-tRNA ligase 1 [Candidatus Daviesbacteria bacterium GW2011_GWA1_42_6]KKS70752.1 MAG: Proline-tRNA ligase 1 [Candidatus Daviesbacteria bacterium GW2011_GWA2_42_7]OGE20324.1 MAG: proline--tRNA ligase [Candidatus Daviesbacteria bacterium RIFCSPHIGHO2_01_FULL_43_17]OGE36819.1 MAG: proline--tRNA ligase [Candidatus Daviesbacteria bacterium RIFCSPHIGHO2_12_FULL_43_11]OGE64043.1 MAG: proline--tRNA ligase [Candidatus Daviesbacteria bacterium RIFCSPLOWO2_01_FULL_43_38]
MKYSKLFPKTIKQVPQDTTLKSHQLLYRGGFIRESVAGRYYFLPLALRVNQKIQAIIKDEMDKAGGQELSAPILHPIALWKETNRTTSVGFELMKVKDRNEMEFVLGGTAEEMIVDLIRKFQISYKDLPLNLYQFSTKFRDELRARGGLLRTREFTMKDAYSFDVSEEEFKKEYRKMGDVYTRMFERMGLKTIVVESDNGYIGGEYCHEFVVESEVGESKFLVNKDGTYAAHEDVARFIPEKKNAGEVEKLLQEVEVVRGATMEDGVKLHNLPLWQQIKDVLFVDENGRFILAIIRGDYDVNETKLLHIIKAYQLRHATEEEIREKIHSEPGFISPVGIKDIVDKNVELIIVADETLATIKNAYGGANKKDMDLLNMNMGRDFKPDIVADIALAKEGDIAPDGSGPLAVKRGIEVGNIFQLGFHYSSRMVNATFIDKDGKPKPYYMGCYGIGLGRTMATIAEISNDEKGIIWPEGVAPYKIHLVGLDLEEESVKGEAERVYKLLQAEGLEVLFDDRIGISAGEKFADADLIGIPYRVVVSKKTGDKLEVKKRSEKEIGFYTLEEFLKILG